MVRLHSIRKIRQRLNREKGSSKTSRGESNKRQTVTVGEEHEYEVVLLKDGTKKQHEREQPPRSDDTVATKTVSTATDKSSTVDRTKQETQNLMRDGQKNIGESPTTASSYMYVASDGQEPEFRDDRNEPRQSDASLFSMTDSSSGIIDKNQPRSMSSPKSNPQKTHLNVNTDIDLSFSEAALSPISQSPEPLDTKSPHSFKSPSSRTGIFGQSPADSSPKKTTPRKTNTPSNSSVGGRSKTTTSSKKTTKRNHLSPRKSSSKKSPNPHTPKRSARQSFADSSPKSNPRKTSTPSNASTGDRSKSIMKAEKTSVDKRLQMTYSSSSSESYPTKRNEKTILELDSLLRSRHGLDAAPQWDVSENTNNHIQTKVDEALRKSSSSNRDLGEETPANAKQAGTIAQPFGGGEPAYQLLQGVVFKETADVFAGILLTSKKKKTIVARVVGGGLFSRTPIEVGDEIFGVNNVLCTNMETKEIADLIHAAQGEVTVMVGRPIQNTSNDRKEIAADDAMVSTKYKYSTMVQEMGRRQERSSGGIDYGSVPESRDDYHDQYPPEPDSWNGMAQTSWETCKTFQSDPPDDSDWYFAPQKEDEEEEPDHGGCCVPFCGGGGGTADEGTVEGSMTLATLEEDEEEPDHAQGGCCVTLCAPCGGGVADEGTVEGSMTLATLEEEDESMEQSGCLRSLCCMDCLEDCMWGDDDSTISTL